MLRHLAFVRLSVNFFCFRLTPPTVYIRSLGIWLDHDGATHIVSGVIVHQILELCPFENFCKLFISGQHLLHFTSNQAETSLILRL